MPSSISKPTSRFASLLLTFALLCSAAIGAALLSPQSVAPAEAQGAPTPVDPLTLDETPVLGPGVIGFIQPSVGQNWRVHAFAQIGDNVFVGGSFAQVRDLPYSNATTHAQPFLAAFNVNTGAFVPGFAPVLDDAVWALEVSNGKLVVGGEFNTVNGAAREGLVMLDPITGATDPTFDATIANVGSNFEASVRALQVVGSDIYVVGDFNRLVEGGDQHGQFRTARVNATTGNIDDTFDPFIFGGAVFDIHVDTTYNKIYLAGTFTAVNGATGTKTVAVLSMNGATLANHEWLPNHSGNTRAYSIAVLDDRVYIGGEQHAVMVRDRVTWAYEGCFATGFHGTLNSTCGGNGFPFYCCPGGGGDYQVVETIGNFIATGCHCRDESLNTFTGQTIDLEDAGLRLYDTNSVDIDFSPGATIWNQGPYAAFGDSNGCLLIGGDLTGTVDGFARYCTPEPTVPFGPPQATFLVTGNTVTIDWPPSESTKGYLVHKDHVYQQFSTQPGYSETVPDGTYRYDIRAQRPDNTYSDPTTLIVQVGVVPPLTTPTNFGVTLDGTTATATWDPVAVATGYLVHRNWQFLAYKTTTTHVDSNLTPGETYRYQVRSQNAGGNSDPSELVTVVVPGPPDNQAPTIPTNAIGVLSNNNQQIDLTWGPSTDNIAVTGYLVHLNWQFRAYVQTTSYTDNSLTPGSIHRYQIRGQDAAGNNSEPTPMVIINVP